MAPALRDAACDFADDGFSASTHPIALGYAMDKPCWKLLNRWLLEIPLFPAQRRVCEMLFGDMNKCVVVEAPQWSGANSLISIVKAVSERLYGDSLPVILGPTQLAAARIGGQTFAAFSQQHLFADLDQFNRAAKIKQLFSATLLGQAPIYILYHLTADQLDTLDLILRVANGNASPFGGKKVSCVIPCYG